MLSGSETSDCKLLFLHGFPECAISWMPQLEGLADHAFCVAPDLRGCGLSERPTNVSDYHRDALIADVAAIADALEWERFHLIGHDWGGILGWWAAEELQDRVRRLATLSAPHPSLLARAILDDPVQASASAYIDALCVPGAADRLAEDLEGLFARTIGKAGRIAKTHKENYLESWTGPGGLQPAINWYTANAIRSTGGPRTASLANEEPKLTCPLLVIHGSEDQAFVPELFEASAAVSPHGQLITLDQVDHWPGMERPSAANAMLRQFLID